RAQLLDGLDRLCVQELLDLPDDRLPDVGDGEETLLVEVLQIGVVAADGPRRLLVGARLVRITARAREEFGVLVEDRFDVPGGASHAVTRRPRTARPAGPSACGGGSRPGPTPRSAGRRSPRR